MLDVTDPAQLVIHPLYPIPGRPEVRWLETRDGVRLRVALWRRPSTSAGTLLLLHGYAEFIEKYLDLVAHGLARGYAVIMADWRGHGASDRALAHRRKGHVDDFGDFRADLEALLDLAVAELPGPYRAIAHSMGGAALLLALDHGEGRLERAVLSAPLTGLATLRKPRWAHALAAMLDALALGGAFVPGGGPTPKATRPFADNLVTSDPEQHARFAALVTAYPDLALGDPTIGWTLAMFRAFARFAARDFGRGITTPTLWLLPGSDALCSTPAAAALADRVRGARSIIIPGAKHELLFERPLLRDQALAAIDAFLPGDVRP